MFLLVSYSFVDFSRVFPHLSFLFYGGVIYIHVSVLMFINPHTPYFLASLLTFVFTFPMFFSSFKLPFYGFTHALVLMFIQPPTLLTFPASVLIFYSCNLIHLHFLLLMCFVFVWFYSSTYIHPHSSFFLLLYLSFTHVFLTHSTPILPFFLLFYSLL